MEITAESGDLVLRTNDYKGSKEYFERKVSEQEIIAKAMRSSVMQLKSGLVTRSGQVLSEKQR